MEGMRLLHKLRLTNFLSYGPEGTEIELQPLNVLIGPNGSGKSNLIEAISLLKAAPSDISKPIREGGGMTEFLWKGASDSSERQATLETTVSGGPNGPIRHRLVLQSFREQLDIVEEAIHDTEKTLDEWGEYYSYRKADGEAVLRRWAQDSEDEPPDWRRFPLPKDHFDSRQSILSQMKDPVNLRELTHLASTFSEIALFRNNALGHGSRVRGPQKADESASFLLEDGRNFGIVLSDLLNQPTTKRTLLQELHRFYDRVDDITTKVHANTVETFLHERGLSASIPSLRLSDGTLHYLCLLAILCHPSPPPLVCIEDPEIGLHPDALPRLADLLLEASERMQLIVTTHSDVVVSALSDVPEAVVVCERDDGGSHLRRLEPERLKEWLENYSLGELWRMGETGGNP